MHDIQLITQFNDIDRILAPGKINDWKRPAFKNYDYYNSKIMQ